MHSASARSVTESSGARALCATQSTRYPSEAISSARSGISALTSSEHASSGRMASGAPLVYMWRSPVGVS